MDESGIRVLIKHGMKIHEKLDYLDSTLIHAVIVRSVFKVSEAFLGLCPHLAFVGKLGTGLDNIDTQACAHKQIEVWHCPGKNAVSTAEFALTQVMAHFKKVPDIHTCVVNRDYRRHLMMGRELAKLELGVLGYGGVGRALAKKSSQIFKKVHVLDKNFKKNIEMNGVQYHADLHHFLGQSDAVILAIPLKNNENLVNMEFLSYMKKDALLVNISRGGIIHEADMLSMLSRHPDFFFITDVLTHEPDYTLSSDEQSYDHPLLKLNNCLFTPHIAGMTTDCQAEIAVLLANRLVSKFGL